MLKNNFPQQIKQNILNYQIKTIEECNDSLFTENASQHERYLCWQLGEDLRHILDHYDYQYRWIGNDPSAYIFAYFYVVVIGSANSSTNMMELKLVLYQLGRKYLALFQQKLLIQFLCLIQYSQDRYLFFRKYSKIQTILLKIFKQIETRSQLPMESSNRGLAQQFNSFSKLTTCVTSPSQNKGPEDALSKLIRNSDYYNSSMKRVEREYQKLIASRPKKSSHPSKQIYIQWYQIYNKTFHFAKMKIESQKHARIRIDFDRTTNATEEYIIAVEKGCFFVVELKCLQTYFNNILQGNARNNGVEESQMYLNQLIQNQIQKGKILAKMKEHRNKKSSKTDSFGNTPKFISNKKNLSYQNKDFYKSQSDFKNVSIEVLNISHFDQSKVPQNSQRSAQEEGEARGVQVIQYKKKIQNLDSVNQTVQTYNSGKNSIIEDIKSHPNFPVFLQNKGKAIKTEQSIPRSNFPFDNNIQRRDHYKHNRNIQSKYSVSNNPEMIAIKNRREAHPNNGNKNINNPTRIVRSPKESNSDLTKDLYPTKITQMSSNQTVLSAAVLRKSYKYAHQPRNHFLFQQKVNPKIRPYYSNSPPNNLAQDRCQYYSPSRASGTKPPMNFFSKTKVKFTYK